MTGYESKRAAARDKLEDDDTQVYQDDTLTIAYKSGFYDGKKAAAQEPTKYSFRAHWEEDGCIGVVAAIERLDGGVHLLKDTIDAPQPAQEPVAHLCGPDENGLFGLPTADKACKDCFPVYTAPPQPKQEPVAKFDEVWDSIDWDKWRMEPIREVVKMIHSKTTPPQRPWVDLTDEEFDELEYRFARYELCRAIGAALRSKNT